MLGQWLCKQIGEAFGCDKIIEPIARVWIQAAVDHLGVTVTVHFNSPRIAHNTAH